MRFITANKCIKLAIFLGGIGALFIVHKIIPNTQQLYPESQQPMPVIRKLKIGADPNGSHDEVIHLSKAISVFSLCAPYLTHTIKTLLIAGHNRLRNHERPANDDEA